MSEKSEQSIIRETPNYRKTVLGKCPVFQDSASRSLASSSVSYTDLEDVVCKAITKASVALSDKDIDDCHQVGKRGPTIGEFCKTKMSKQVLNVRKELAKLLMEDLQCQPESTLLLHGIVIKG